MKMSKLVSKLSHGTIRCGDNLYTKGSSENRVVIIDKGWAIVDVPDSLKESSSEEIDKALGICRSIPPDPAGGNSSLAIIKKANVPTQHTISEGCVVGISLLRGRARMNDGWSWGDAPGHTSVASGKATKRDGACCPITISAGSDLSFAFFTMYQFENMFGRASFLLQSLRDDEHDDTDDEVEVEESKNEIPPQQRADKFKMKSFDSVTFLGDVYMGKVALALRTEVSKASGETVQQEYVLKIMSKDILVNSNAVGHALSEALMLSQFDCPFIAKLHGHFQTPNDLVYVLERVPCGDLLSLVEQQSKIADASGELTIKPGLSYSLIKFYGASIVCALDHLRRHGIVYRNLRPENVLLDEAGHIRLVGFGFSKKIPYREPHGARYLHKTFTICGSPGRYVGRWVGTLVGRLMVNESSRMRLISVYNFFHDIICC